VRRGRFGFAVELSVSAKSVYGPCPKTLVEGGARFFLMQDALKPYREGRGRQLPRLLDLKVDAAAWGFFRKKKKRRSKMGSAAQALEVLQEVGLATSVWRQASYGNFLGVEALPGGA